MWHILLHIFTQIEKKIKIKERRGDHLTEGTFI
jgi:hypothetical protein